MQLQEVFSQADEIVVYRDGGATAYVCDSKEFDEIIAEWNAMTLNSIVMPAFGVSINDLTVENMKNGVWTEFVFSTQMESGGMPFEKLLVEVRPEYRGFNVIRYNAEYGYAGRCYYIDLREGNMSAFYQALTK